MRGRKNGKARWMAVMPVSVLMAAWMSMTASAAPGWVEEMGDWFFYEKDGSQAQNVWKQSGEKWYYLDEDGLMACDRLIEDGDDTYYVDMAGRMVTGQWAAIENENYGSDNEPYTWYYYFQDNGKAMKGPDSGKVSLKSINDRKYAFDSDGRMLYGWIEEDDASLMADDEEAWKTGDYYFGDENDGALTLGWMQIDITDDGAGDDRWVNSAFNDNEDQSRWFYFKTNGKKIEGTLDGSGNTVLKEKTINGKKYGFDEYGRMAAEWNYDFSSKATPSVPGMNSDGQYGYDRDQSSSWLYFRSVDDGEKLAKGWFRVVPAENLNPEDYDDEEEGWYYADGRGHLYAGEMQTIGGKKYAFDQAGRMLTGINYLMLDTDGKTIVYSLEGDNEYHPFDTEDGFDENAGLLVSEGGGFYYFGSESDGAMRTNKNKIEIDGDTFTFYFKKGGSNKGSGLIGEEDGRLYNSGKLMCAGRDERYQVVTNGPKSEWGDGGSSYKGYWKFSDSEELKRSLDGSGRYGVYEPERWDKNDSEVVRLMGATAKSFDELKRATGLTSSNPDKYGEIVVYTTRPEDGSAEAEKLGLPNKMEDWTSLESDIGSYGFAVVGTSGKMIGKDLKGKDGSGVYYKLRGGRLTATYTED